MVTGRCRHADSETVKCQLGEGKGWSLALASQKKIPHRATHLVGETEARPGVSGGQGLRLDQNHLDVHGLHLYLTAGSKDGLCGRASIETY